MAEATLSETDSATEEGGKLPSHGRKINNDFLEGFENLGLLRQLGLMIGLAASVAIGFSVVLWTQGESYRPLYGSLEQIDSSEVINILEANDIRYEVEKKSGALLVAEEDIYDARMKLAQAGIPDEQSQGFELLDQEQPLGTSQFMETTRYRRGLEGELARTITSMYAVRKARVHLAIPKQTVFIRDPRKPSASVFLELFSGRYMKPEQVRAIGNLVASSIPELQLKDVTIVDQRGNLLSNFEDDNGNLDVANKQLDYQRKVEDKLIRRIHSILGPLLGEGRFKAEVSADIDFTEVEQTDEQYNPDMAALRSEQSLAEQRIGDDSIGGIPGALTNQPPGNGAAPEQANPQAGGNNTVPSKTRNQSTKNYELDRSVSYTRHQVGQITRLTVAVVVDDMVQVDSADGSVTRSPWPANELERLSVLVRNSVGFSAARGDSVNVINNPFVAREVLEEEIPLWEHPLVDKVLNFLWPILLILILIFFVLKPAFSNLSRNAREAKELEAQHDIDELEGLTDEDYTDETVTLSGGDSIMLPSPDESYEQQLNAIKALIAEDPGRVAQVVKQWVASDE